MSHQGPLNRILETIYVYYIYVYIYISEYTIILYCIWVSHLQKVSISKQNKINVSSTCKAQIVISSYIIYKLKLVIYLSCNTIDKKSWFIITTKNKVLSVCEYKKMYYGKLREIIRQTQLLSTIYEAYIFKEYVQFLI